MPRKKPFHMFREELYERVWQTPMHHLAQEFDITGNALAKKCKRHKIPYPSRGYWAKLAAGKKAQRPKLQEVDEPRLRMVTFWPKPRKPEDLPPEVLAKVTTARHKAVSIKVPKKLNRPHPIIAGWLAEHKRRKQYVRSGLWFGPVDEYSAIDRRRHRILHALFKELERHGAKIEEYDRGGIYAQILGEQVEFQLREKHKQVRQPLTDKERSYRDWRMVLEPTGKLLFVIKSYVLRGLRTEWLETDDESMEMLLPDIIGTIFGASVILLARRRQHEEEERQYHLAAMRQAEEDKNRRLEENRWQQFLKLAEQWHEAQRIRAFLETLRAIQTSTSRHDLDTKALKWIAWAEDQLAQHDPLYNGEKAIFDHLDNVTA